MQRDDEFVNPGWNYLVIVFYMEAKLIVSKCWTVLISYYRPMWFDFEWCWFVVHVNVLPDSCAGDFLVMDHNPAIKKAPLAKWVLCLIDFSLQNFDFIF